MGQKTVVAVMGDIGLPWKLERGTFVRRDLWSHLGDF